MNRVLTFLVLVIFSCETKPDNRNESKNNSVIPQNSIGKASPDINEDFNKFFEAFKSDSLFQLDRVTFPLTTMIWNMEEDKLEKITIEKNTWRFLDFYYNNSFAKRKLNPYTQEIKVYGDTVKLEIRGVDNGLYTNFEFTQQKGKWYLISEKDYSN